MNKGKNYKTYNQTQSLAWAEIKRPGLEFKLALLVVGLRLPFEFLNNKLVHYGNSICLTWKIGEYNEKTDLKMDMYNTTEWQ